jgi:hypothetical protein
MKVMDMYLGEKMRELSMLHDVIVQSRYIWRGELTEAGTNVMVIEESTDTVNYWVLCDSWN